MHKKAFTLFEILIVVIILGVLAAVVLPRYTRTEKIIASEGAQTLTALLGAQQRYALENNGVYSGNTANLDITLPTTSSYFFLPVAQADPNQLGMILRKTGAYTLYISSAGVITCASVVDPSGANCQSAGY